MMDQNEYERINHSKQTETKTCLKSVLYHSLVVFLYMATASAASAIFSQVASQSGQLWIGQTCLSLLYFGSGVGAVYSGYIDKIQFGSLLFFGSLSYTIYVGLIIVILKFGHSILVDVILLIGSFCSGLIISVYYNSQSNYLNICSQIDKQPTLYFGINLTTVQVAYIAGNLISTFFVQPFGGELNYIVIMNISVFVLSTLFLGVRNYQYSKKTTDSISIEQHSIQKQNQLQKHQIIQVNASLQNKVINLTNSQIPYLIYFIFSFTGVMLSFVSSQISIIFHDTFVEHYSADQLSKITFIGFIIQGCGELVGGLFSIFGQDFIHKTIGVSFTYITISLLFLISLFLTYVGQSVQSLNLLYFSVFLAGICDIMGYVLALVMAGKWDQKGMSRLNIIQSISIIVSTLLIIIVKFKFAIIFFITIQIVSMIGAFTQMQIIDNNSKLNQQQKVN